ncbi:hypothetical protein [Fulvivirga ligni]|uniref:hypothetical protein n=1 Tax=Fulvivirga ligni TaxID=2904246 RepID=UPI001F23614C|nr:hypothetical protein [Fulvivirga ligni]UII21107.1 hypothetical protein LVD16_25040 [Fulvivirga ligni]
MPSYIQPRTFSKVLTEIIVTAREVDKIGDVAKDTVVDFVDRIEQMGIAGDSIELLKSYAREANGDWAVFESKLEDWFNQTMERAKGWYNRKLKKITFVVGLTIAIAFNIDTIQVYQVLNRNAEVREAVLQSATAYVNNHKKDTIDAPTDTTKTVVQVSEELGKFLNKQIQPSTNMLGLGWNDETLRGCGASVSGLACIFLKLAGWFITALAISLGSPFWFDLLNKLISLRGSGDNPDKQPSTKKQPVG